jgi:hypothetical protein
MRAQNLDTKGWCDVAGTTEPLAKQLAQRLAAGELQERGGRAFTLALGELRPVGPRTGWFRFALVLGDVHRQPLSSPLMTGIVSGGGRGVMPWFEGRIFPTVEFAGGEQFDARAAGLEAQLIELIGALVPPGGHLMIEYESPAQSETHRELLLRVPPAATYLGALMFRSGFRGAFKDWYISEGGHEGPRKLQANKSPDASAARDAMRLNLEELWQFIRRRPPENAEDGAVVRRAQERARQLVKQFGGNSGSREASTPPKKSRR